MKPFDFIELVIDPGVPRVEGHLSPFQQLVKLSFRNLRDTTDSGQFRKKGADGRS